MLEEEKKYKVVNLMTWNDEEQDDDVECTSLSDEYTKILCEDEELEIYPDSNMYIGKPRYFYMTLEKIQKHVFDKENIDLFCKNNTECYGEEFNIWNPDYIWNPDNIVSENGMVIKYKPNK